MNKAYRKLKRTSSFFYREMTAHKRSVPNTVIIGAQKCGTTSIFYNLIKHPNISGSKIKEVHFFDDNFEKGTRWYRKYFPYKNKLQFKAIIESTPDYMAYPFIPERMKKVLPNVQIIIALRNPVDRMYSAFQMGIRGGWITETNFSKFVHEGIKVSEEPNFGIGAIKSDGQIRRQYNSVLRSNYYFQISRWLTFFPINQFHFVKSEQYNSNPNQELNKILEFLNVSPHDFKQNKSHNIGTYKSSMDPVLRKELHNYFSQQNADLPKLIGEEFVWSLDEN